MNAPPISTLGMGMALKPQSVLGTMHNVAAGALNAWLATWY